MAKNSVDYGILIKELFPAIVDAVREAMPELVTVDLLDERFKEATFGSPACLIYPMDADPADDDGSLQSRFNARIAADVLVSTQEPHPSVVAYGLALKLANVINRNNWGLAGLQEADVIGIAPDYFMPDMGRFEVYRVDFQHVITIGRHDEVDLYLPDAVAVNTVGVRHDDPAYGFLMGQGPLP